MFMKIGQDLQAWLAFNPTRKASGFGVAVILLVFFGSLWVPVLNETGNRVSPATIQTSVDIHFYQASAEILFERPDEIFQLLVDTYSWEGTSPALGPPLFPALLKVFSYGPDNTWPLALLYLVFGCGFMVIWIAVLQKRGMPFIGLAIIALLPQTAWFTISISTDLPFALMVALFFYFYMDADRSRGVIVWIVLLLMVVARTNGLAIVLFYTGCLIFADDRPLRTRLLEVLLLGIATLLLSGVYLPSLLGTVEGSYVRFGHFGVGVDDYLDGLFASLPAILDLPLSWATLFGAKTLYVVGLRPSYGDVSLLTLALRSAPGILLLPGLILLMIQAPRRDRYFVLFFLLPIFLGVTQDRYLLPIIPLVAFYGLQGYASLWVRVRGMARVLSPRRG